MPRTPELVGYVLPRIEVPDDKLDLNLFSGGLHSFSPPYPIHTIGMLVISPLDLIIAVVENVH